MQIKTFNSFNPQHKALYEQILTLTKSVDGTYPKYQKWFNEKFIPGLKKNERMYIVAQEDNGNLVGCALIKKTKDEKKICTLYVEPQFRKQGIGKQLMTQALKELGELPLVTVSDKHLSQLLPLLKQFGFHLSFVKKGVYHPEDTEYYFNDPKAESIKTGLIPVLIKRMQKLRQR